MKMKHVSLYLMLIVDLCIPVTTWSSDSEGQDIDQIGRDIEQPRFERLARIQNDPQNKLSPFATDGCSGGLSSGWRFLATALPAFKDKFGDKPPYEGCCVEHDRAYWRGETVQGFDKRLQADQTLKQCVATYGKQHKQEFAQEFHLSPEIIMQNFTIISTLMYKAVRVGGIPCSKFSWRWGYGWPPCNKGE